MELFSEIYNCYFTILNRLLNNSKDGITRSEIEKLVGSEGFTDTAFLLLPHIYNNSWKLMKEENGSFYSNLSGSIKRPYSDLEKSWLKALIYDPRIGLFMDKTELEYLTAYLSEVNPLFNNSQFHIYDRYRDGDNYSNKNYIENFRAVLNAIRSKKIITIEYLRKKDDLTTKRNYIPYRLCYSERDDKFRLQCAAFNQKTKRLVKITLNMSRIIATMETGFDFETTHIEQLYSKMSCKNPVVIEIYRERNALERCLLQFASYKRHTEYDRERDLFTCRIWYDPSDEADLLIRILSFGPAVKVLGPEGFLHQIKERISRQQALNNKYTV